MRSRPPPVTVAAILLALFSVLNLLSPLFPTEGIPAVVVYLAVVVGVVGLVGAAGLWRLRKWGLWLTICVSVLNILSAAPGLSEAPNAALQIAATVTVLVFVFIIVLIVLPSSRRAIRSRPRIRED
jgi:uncharacterized membrane protein HdeD (DUF308 family)